VVVPDGWVLTSLDPNNRPGCAAGYGSPQDVVVAADGLGCTCKCTETAPGSCAASGATAAFRTYSSAGCGTGSIPYTMFVLDGGCDNIPITTQQYNRVPTAPAMPPTCAADAGPTPLKSGQACLAQGASCNDGGTCAGALPDAVSLVGIEPGEIAVGLDLTDALEAAVPAAIAAALGEMHRLDATTRPHGLGPGHAGLHSTPTHETAQVTA
jgi:hypothetical protein